MICTAPYVIDGDTIACSNLPAHIRLLGIDAPELAGHCRKGRVCVEGSGPASRDVMRSLVARGQVQCQPEGYDRYRRIDPRAVQRRPGRSVLHDVGDRTGRAALQRYLLLGYLSSRCLHIVW
ncbi:thermonuclease family protein [Glacieibacterium sp.]|uniref:thermonuclease family protein n=1 Tax=Glacieibacterium sp. TaxID=2860237 RepID=UPI003B0066BE